MLSYLHNAGLHGSYETLKKETDLDDFEVDDPKAKWVGLLEKKWTSVIRLQKKASTPTSLLCVTDNYHTRSWTSNLAMPLYSQN